jgi:hypothetical protein
MPFMLSSKKFDECTYFAYKSYCTCVLELDIYSFVKWIVCVCETGEQNQAIFSILQLSSTPEAEFLDVIGTLALRVFLLAIHSHLH